MGSDFMHLWPRWPEKTEGTVAVDVHIGWSVDTTFDKLWGKGSEFSAHVREARNIKDYVEGPWVKDELLEEAISTGQQDKGAMSPVFTSRSQFAGQSRKVRFEQAGSGGILKAAYANEEVQRCIEAIEGEGYLLYCCISTNAPYGDRVRIVLKYRLAATGGSSSSITVSYSVHWVKPTNAMLKGVITSGIDMGVKRNFATLRELLSELVEVKDNTQAAEDKADTAAAAAAIDGTGVNLGTGAATAGFLSRLAMAESQLLGAALPIAVWLEKHPVAGKAVALCGRDALSASISVAMVLLVLKVFMALKIYVGEPFAEFCTDEGCHPGLGQALCFVYSLGYLLDLPDSIWEVFCSLVLLAGVQWAAASLLTLAPFQASIPAAAPPPPTVAAEDTEPSEAETREGHAEEPLSTKSVVQAEVQKGLATIKTGLMDISSTVIDGVQRSLIRNAVQSSTSVRPPVGSTPIQPTKPILRSAEVTALETGSKDDNDHAAAGEKPQVPPCAELFENERYQPLRGWGHSWPGHFMPGDFRHWSNATDASSMVCTDVRPVLPDGYQWDDPDWKVDMSGHADDAVDEEGWSYGVHWMWLTNPPNPGAGQRKASVFVRRRRWVRGWIPKDGEKEGCVDDMKEPSIPGPTREEVQDSESSRGGVDIASKLASVGEMFRGSMHAGMAANAEAKEPGAAPIPSPASASPPASETKWPPETAKQEHCQQEILESNLGKPLCAPAVPGVLGAGALNATDPSRPTDDQEGICFPAGPPPGDAKNSTTSEQPVAQPEPEGQLARPQEELEATDLQIQGHAGDEPQTRGGLQETIELPPESGKLPANFIAGISADTAELAADLEGSSLQMQTSDCSAAAQVPDPEDMRSPSITCEPHYLNRLQSPETEDLIVGKGRTEALHPGDITTGMKTGDEHDFYGLPDAPSSTAADSDEGGWLDERFSFESEQAAVATSPEAVSDSRTSSPEAHDTLTAAQDSQSNTPSACAAKHKVRASEDGAGTKFKRMMQNTRLGEKVSGAVATVGSVISMGGTSSEATGEASFKEPLVSMPINSSIADSSLPGSGGLPDLMDTDKSLVGTSSAGASAWHIRAVSDVRKYVGEVDMDRVGGAAHRVSTEMNVAAKKLTGEMGDAAKKLSDLFGRTVAATRMSLKAAETEVEHSTSEQSSHKDPSEPDDAGPKVASTARRASVKGAHQD